MCILLEILKISIPALIVALTAYFTLRKLSDKELKKQVLDLKFNSRQLINPIRLQAYERLALFLERIKPESLLMRNQGNALNAGQYRIILLTSIRNEFEHNLSQQVYVSSALWEATKKAKEESSKMINLAAGKVGIEASGNDLATQILDMYMQIKLPPADIALELLRQEIKELY
ncbi:MAG: hypothetical protein LBH82_00045 [Bacteroidales bacterium]|jgi:hypothetical protein|nr:hypothetical protein [Bacteroidales bacterium]